MSLENGKSCNWREISHFCAKYPKYLVVPETIDNFATSNVWLSEKKKVTMNIRLETPKDVHHISV